MIGRSINRHAGRLSLVVLAIFSALSTAAIIADASGSSGVRLAVLAAARGRALQSRAAVVAALGARDRADAAAGARAAAPVSAGAGSGTSGASSGAAAAANASPAAPSGSTGSGTNATPPAATTPASSPVPTTPAPAAATPVATVSHLFEIVLTGTGYAASFGSGSQMPYLRSLTAHGTLLSGYRSLGHGALADELALVSGQAPNSDTSSGCPNYTEFPTGVALTATGLVAGAGCVYPETVLTLGDQIGSAGHQWRAYVAGMGARSCQHPNSNTPDSTVLPGAAPSYDTRANPFIYFHSLLDLGDCVNDDLDLSRFHLGSGRSAPSLVYLAPSLCEQPPQAPSAPSSATPGATTTPIATSTTSQTTTTTTSSTATGSSSPPLAGPAATSACPAGRPSGAEAENAFLKSWVPRILASAAYHDHGALVIAMTQRAGTGHPVRTGALVLSSAQTRGRTLAGASDPYGLLRADETALGLGLLAKAKHAAAPAVFRSAHPAERTRSAGNHS